VLFEFISESDQFEIGCNETMELTIKIRQASFVSNSPINYHFCTLVFNLKWMANFEFGASIKYLDLFFQPTKSVNNYSQMYIESYQLKKVVVIISLKEWTNQKSI